MNGQKVNRLVIRTPEGCSFSLLLAGPFARFLAWFVDLLLVLVALFVLTIFFGTIIRIAGDLAAAVYMVSLFVLWFGYGICFEWFWRGRTIGKRVFGLRVVHEHGLRLTFRQVTVRNLLRMVDSLPGLYLVGGLTCLLTRRAQRLGDLAAGTVVIRTRKLSPPDLTRLSRDKFNSFRTHPHIEARLRQRTLPQEARIALQALLRRDRLTPAARVDLFAALAAHFASIAEFPHPATEDLSDEQYVRNVVDTLFRAQMKERAE